MQPSKAATQALPGPRLVPVAREIDPEFQAALSWPERAKTLKVIDAATLQLAADERAAAKALIVKAHESFDPICKSAYDAWQVAIRKRAEILDPLEQAVKIYDSAMVAYNREQERIARETQRKLEEEARLRELEEREREIEHAEATGATPAEVASIIERPIVAPPVVAPAPAKPAGAVIKQNWKGRISDMRTFITHLVQNKRWELLGLLAEDSPACNKLAGSIKNTGSIPGFEAWDAGSVASTASGRMPRRS